MAESNGQKVVVVGAGPVGTLAALYAGHRGDHVVVYELRGDLREESTVPLNFTRSINLALSERGINSLRQARQERLLDDVLRDTIPMCGRMIHGKDKRGSLTAEEQLYDVHGRAILAADRATLNKKLLDALHALPNVTVLFDHKLTGVDYNAQKAWFEKRDGHGAESGSHRAPEIEVPFDLLIGADGAHSAARHHLMKYARLSYQQEYIDTLWCEFRIEPRRTDDGDDEKGAFALSPHHLHIWPGRHHMFIAIPSADRAFTCTLFATAGTFRALAADPPGWLPDFFAVNFPGVSPELIPTAALLEQFGRNPHLPLISITCSPYHYGGAGVILGDAAHAMVPFYGQGMNAGLEDVRVLFDCLDAHGVYARGAVSTADTSKTPENATAAAEKAGAESATAAAAPASAQVERRARALAAYTVQRAPDAAAIGALAMRNYREMRADVVSPLYRARKRAEEALSRWAPALGWQTQYRRVSFTSQPYAAVVRAVRRQERALALLALLALGAGAGLLGWLLRQRRAVLLRRWLARWLHAILQL